MGTELVVRREVGEVVMEAYEVERKEKETAARGKRGGVVYGWWKKVIVGICLKARLERDYL